MVEFPQSVPNITEASTNLFELIRDRNLAVYADDDFRRSITHCVAKETPRGWHISKSKASHKIDCIVALSMAALAAVRAARRYGSSPPALISYDGLGFVDHAQRFHPTTLTTHASSEAYAEQQRLMRQYARPAVYRDGVRCAQQHGPSFIIEATSQAALTERMRTWRCGQCGAAAAKPVAEATRITR
jgi:hypothetical protein